MDLKQAGPRGSGPQAGIQWGKMLKNYIDGVPDPNHETAQNVIDNLKREFDGIEFLETEFPLYGYMVHKEEGKKEVCLWNGKADAIAWCKDEYVIVDWKAVDLNEFWEKNSRVYKEYLHQCLVYSRLLKLHLNLEKLPPILIVAISNFTGKDVTAGYFHDFPDECKKELEKYVWSKEINPSENEKTNRLSLQKELVKNEIEVGLVGKEKKICDILKNDCTVGDFVAALGFDELEIF